MLLIDDAPGIARSWLGSLGRRWDHVQTAGRLADDLVSARGLPREVAAAVWLHDVGYAGVPAHVVRDILGHEDIKVTNLYARQHDDAMSLAAAALAAYSGRE